MWGMRQGQKRCGEKSHQLPKDAYAPTVGTPLPALQPPVIPPRSAPGLCAVQASQPWSALAIGQPREAVRCAEPALARPC